MVLQFVISFRFLLFPSGRSSGPIGLDYPVHVVRVVTSSPNILVEVLKRLVGTSVYEHTPGARSSLLVQRQTLRLSEHVSFLKLDPYRPRVWDSGRDVVLHGLSLRPTSTVRLLGRRTPAVRNEGFGQTWDPSGKVPSGLTLRPESF